MKNTLGPWSYWEMLSGSENVKGYGITDNKRNWRIAIVSPIDQGGEEGRANARLIAAAPELLEALQAEEEWRRRYEYGALDPELDYERMVGDKRRDAIAKAEGK